MGHEHTTNFDEYDSAGFDEDGMPWATDDDALWSALSSYYDGEASPEERARIEALISSNPAIARDFAFLDSAGAAVRDFVELEPPVAMADAIFASTTRRKTTAQRVAGWWNGLFRARVVYPLAMSAAAAGLLLFVMWPKHRPATIITGVAVDKPARSVAAAPVSSDPKIGSETTGDRAVRNALAAANSAKPHGGPLLALDLPRLEPYMPDFRSHAAGKRSLEHSAAASSTKPDLTAHVKPDTMSGTSSPLLARHDERHMPAAIASEPKVDLGADIVPKSDADSGSVALASEHVKVTPAVEPAVSDVPPTHVVAVSYTNLRTVTRSAPQFDSLITRTNRAIQREFQQVQYGGYDKATITRLENHEIGISVGGRF